MSGRGPLLGAIEAGGTKFVLAAGADPAAPLRRHVIPTTSPEETLNAAASWFEQQGGISALGIACFGPVDLDRGSPTWGHVMTTPKPGWSGCDVAGFLGRRLDVPVGFETDVNAAALAEYQVARGEGASSLAYVTVGTGIGGGLVIDGAPVHGAAHPEMGHLFPRREPGDEGFAGVCPFHHDCLEGLASGPAITARWGVALSELAPDHPAHAIIAGYLAQLCQAIAAVTAVERVVLGGGVLKTPGLIDRIRLAADRIDGGYLPGRARRTIGLPRHGDEAGVRGALLLARQAGS